MTGGVKGALWLLAVVVVIFVGFRIVRPREGTRSVSVSTSARVLADPRLSSRLASSSAAARCKNPSGPLALLGVRGPSKVIVREPRRRRYEPSLQRELRHPQSNCSRRVGLGIDCAPATSVEQRFRGPVAQWSEQGTHNPSVAGSIPAGPTTKLQVRAFAACSTLRRFRQPGREQAAACCSKACRRDALRGRRGPRRTCPRSTVKVKAADR